MPGASITSISGDWRNPVKGFDGDKEALLRRLSMPDMLTGL